MSIRKTLDLCRSSAGELRDGWRFYLPLAGAYILFIWTQDLIPLLGPVVSSVFTTLLTARLFSVSWRERRGALIGLGILFFPINALWTILMSLHLNTTVDDAMSSAWSIPALFLMTIALTAHGFTVRRLLGGAANLDKALGTGWKDLTARFFSLTWLWFFLTAAFALCLASRGYGFLVVTPFALVLLKDSTTALSSTVPADRRD